MFGIEISHYGQRVAWPTILCFVGSIVAPMGLLGNLAGRLIPVEERIEQITHKIEKVTVKLDIPDNNVPRLSDSKQACHGSPVVVVTSAVNGSVEEPNKKFTWMTVQPLGDPYRVQCYLEGKYNFQVGDVVALPQGRVSSLE